MGKDISLKVYPSEYIVLDIETTGLSPLKNEIIELSALKIIGGEISDTFSQLVKPAGRISRFISDLTGITNEMLEGADSVSNVLSAFSKFVDDSVIVGHNIKFDIRFLDFNYRKYFDIPFDNDFVDTLRLARRYLPELKSHRLGLLAEYYNFDNSGMHRALKDCEVTNLCYKEFLKFQNNELLIFAE